MLQLLAGVIMDVKQINGAWFVNIIWQVKKIQFPAKNQLFLWCHCFV